MEATIIALAIALAVETVALTALCCTLPRLWRDCLKLEIRLNMSAAEEERRHNAAMEKIGVLDETVAHLAELAGVPGKETK